MLDTRLVSAFLLIIPATALLALQSQTVWDGVYTAEQAKRGAEVYANHCASCHGLALTGGEVCPRAHWRRIHVELEQPHGRRSF